jgi:hypothetical protein
MVEVGRHIGVLAVRQGGPAGLGSTTHSCGSCQPFLPSLSGCRTRVGGSNG